jgi:hypothetical protein
MALTKTHSRMIAGSAVNVIDFGAVGDGVADDTAAIQAAVNSGAFEIIIPEGTYSTGAISVSSNVRKITGSGTFKQKALGANVLSISVNNILIDGIKFVSAATYNVTTSASSNTAVSFSGVSNVKVTNCIFETFSYFGVYAENSTDVIVSNNQINNCFGAVRYRGVTRGIINNNLINGGLNETEFHAVIGLDSTNGHSFGVCNQISIDGNVLNCSTWSEAIMVHAGIDVVVSDNAIKNASFGIGANTFNATDTTQNITITGNAVTLRSATSGSATANYCIFVGGSSVNFNPASTTISNNVCRDGNRALLASNQGAIAVQYCQSSTISGNSIINSYGAGIVVNDNATQININGNVIDSVSVASGITRGISVVNSSSDIAIRENIIRSVSGEGIRVESTVTSASVNNNTFRSVTSPVVLTGTNDASVSDSYLSYTTAGASITLSAGGAEFINWSPTSASDVSSFSNMVRGKPFTIQLGNSDATITQGTDIKLTGSTNITGGAGGFDTVTFMPTSNTRCIEIARSVK